MSKMSKDLPEIFWVRLAKNLDGDSSKKAKKTDGLSVVSSLGGQLDKQGGGIKPMPRLQVTKQFKLV